MFQLVYLNCVIFYNEATNVLLTIELNHVVHEEGEGGIFSVTQRKQVFQLVYLNCVIFYNELTPVHVFF